MFQASIGSVVKAWREARGLTVTQLAARAGRPITKGYISQLEHDKIRQPGDEHLLRLAQALDIPVENLLTRRLPDGSVRGSPAPRQQPTPEQLEREALLLERLVALVEELRSVLADLLAQRNQP